MNNATSRWDDCEVIKSSWTPFQEFKSFVVSLELYLFVFFPSILDSRYIDLDWMINNQIYWTKRINFFGISSKPHHSISHSSKINNSWYTGKILKNDPSWFEWNLNLFFRKSFPVQNVLNITGFNFEFITVSDSTFK